MRYAARPATAGAAKSPSPMLSEVSDISIVEGAHQKKFLAIQLRPLLRMHKQLFQPL